MKKLLITLSLPLVIFTFTMCRVAEKSPVPGAYQIDLYKNLIKGKTVAILANQTSMVGNKHLVDTLLSYGVDIKLIFSPEHGFRNMADAGEKVENSKDPSTGIQLVSLYGSHNKPTPEDLAGVDVVIFDIQDVGDAVGSYIRYATERKTLFNLLDYDLTNLRAWLISEFKNAPKTSWDWAWGNVESNLKQL